MRLLVTDTAADSIATWAVEDEGRVVGTVSQTPRERYRVTDAGPYCRTPRGDYRDRSAATRALVSARRNCRAEQVDASGLMKIERDVLTSEASQDTRPAHAERERAAAHLGISPTLYYQIVRRLRLDPRAYALDPRAVEGLRAQHEAALSRTARFHRPAPAVLAEAS